MRYFYNAPPILFAVHCTHVTAITIAIRDSRSVARLHSFLLFLSFSFSLFPALSMFWPFTVNSDVAFVRFGSRWPGEARWRKNADFGREKCRRRPIKVSLTSSIFCSYPAMLPYLISSRCGCDNSVSLAKPHISVSL